MIDHLRRVARLEHHAAATTDSMPEVSSLSEMAAAARLHERLYGLATDCIGQPLPARVGGWLGPQGELREDLPAEVRAKAEEVLVILARAAERERAAREHGDDGRQMHEVPA